MENGILFSTAGAGRVYGIWDNQHINRLDRLYRICGGTGYYTVGGETLPFLRDQIYYLPWTVEYTLSQDPDDPLDHVFLDFMQCSPFIGTGILNINACGEPSILKIASFLCDMVELMSHEILPDFRIADGEPHLFGTYNSMMQTCLSTLMTRLEMLVGTPVSTDNEDIYKALSYIHEHYSEQITVDQLASLVCLNKRYFIGKFHSVIGKTPYRYLQSVRYDMAMVHHRYGMPLLKAAEKVGFTSASSIYRMRKQ